MSVFAFGFLGVSLQLLEITLHLLQLSSQLLLLPLLFASQLVALAFRFCQSLLPPRQFGQLIENVIQLLATGTVAPSIGLFILIAFQIHFQLEHFRHVLSGLLTSSTLTLLLCHADIGKQGFGSLQQLQRFLLRLYRPLEVQGLQCGSRRLHLYRCGTQIIHEHANLLTLVDQLTSFRTIGQCACLLGQRHLQFGQQSRIVFLPGSLSSQCLGGALQIPRSQQYFLLPP